MAQAAPEAPRVVVDQEKRTTAADGSVSVTPVVTVEAVVEVAAVMAEVVVEEVVVVINQHILRRPS